jgi:protein-L-isoaspartate(D-aspartate) O-methyltransferase
MSMGSMEGSDDFAAARQRMVDEQLRSRDITDVRVLAAMLAVPRHLFVPPDMRSFAYSDGPLPIGQGQTISQPYIVALMTQLLELEGYETVLEVGTGSGYQAAVLSHLAQHVHTIERSAELSELAREVLDRLGIENVSVRRGDGSGGLPEFAPYHGVIVTAAAPRVPPPLLDQLEDDGRLVVPVGSRDGQVLECWSRDGEDFHVERIAPVAFVPLIGDHGWPEETGEPRWL